MQDVRTRLVFFRDCSLLRAPHRPCELMPQRVASPEHPGKAYLMAEERWAVAWEKALHGGLVPSLRMRRFSPGGLETPEMKQVSETRTRLCEPLESRKRQGPQLVPCRACCLLRGNKGEATVLTPGL